MLKFYNTLTRKKEDFIPQDNHVGMYSCGPTVYNYAHIGNMRTYLFMDILVRTLKYHNIDVMSVMNITDVGHLLSDADDGEDKMAKAAKEQKKTPKEIADFFTKVFFEDLQKLNILKPTVTPKATDNIVEMVDVVKQLLQKGYAYKTTDGIYYDISKFADYGKLSRINLDEQKSGARVEVNEEKRNSCDFALWKNAAPEHIMQWQTEWGMGYPGWHIECTAMSRKYLGDTFDIHTGGVDHIPIHHENEIAQGTALTGKPPAKFWMHGEFMLVDNGKMSKSLGNTYTIAQLEQMGYSAMVFRYFCLNTHYRKKLNFTFPGLDAAKVAYERLTSLVLSHKEGNESVDQQTIDAFVKEFESAIDDDLNIPLALATLFNVAKQQKKSKQYYDLICKMDTVFGLNLANAKKEEKANDIPQEIVDLANRRLQAKKDRNFAEADKLRNEITQQGYVILDSKDGFEIKKA